MSEAILKALIEMLGIIAKQDGGIDDNELAFVESFLIQQLGADAAQSHIHAFKVKAGLLEDEKAAKKKRRLLDLGGDSKEEGDDKKGADKTSVLDSVRILAMSKKINKTLDAKQKVVVLVRLFELVNTSKRFTEQRMAIISTVSEVFNITGDEYKNIRAFVEKNEIEELDNEELLIVTPNDYELKNSKVIKNDTIDKDIYILRVPSTELYFLRYTGNQDNIFLNTQSIMGDRIYMFAPGSTIRPGGKPVYYTDVVATFQSDNNLSPLSFKVTDLEYRFPSGGIGLRNIAFGESQGKLVGIMGASGAGKTTLLNVLSGITSPSKGSVKINGIDLHRQKEQLEGVIGLIPQDDLLIEELTVFENLYYNAKFCFRDKSEAEITELVDNVLKNLGLYERRNLKVGNTFNKLISGGQRKRLNIALELVREPSVLFVDEPTSGLSSRDSQNVMDLLNELTLKGKLIFVVIHQPSSDIYKMFDKMIILDTGGYMVYYGNPIEAISHFKKIDGQVNSEQGECPVCGNATPEIIFDIIESRMVDEFGHYQDQRKIQPEKWEEYYHQTITPEVIDDITADPPKNLSVPGWFKQLSIYFARDVKSKISNLQYIFLNLTEAPLLGFILSFLIRYIAPNKPGYIFYENENIVPYIFMSIVVALFLGLTVSAEEIFRDRKILKRENFLNLSRSSYLVSKVVILTIISAIQAFLYVIVGNSILQVQNMYFSYWLVLFAMFVFANMMGLNISSAFNSAVTIYILIPLLMIPQMALGGSMFSFDKLNSIIGSVGKVPIIAEVMASRWSYEAIMVKQFKDNKFEKDYYESEKQHSYADFKQVYYINELRKANSAAIECKDMIDENDPEYNIDSLKEVMEYNLVLIRTEAKMEAARLSDAIVLDCIEDLYVDKYTDDTFDEVDVYLDDLDNYYKKIFNVSGEDIENRKKYYENKRPGYYQRMRDKYHNEKLQDIVTNVYEKKKIIRYNNQLIQQVDPVYLDADNTSFFGFRSHFYAPRKYFLGSYYDTFYFNIVVIWLMSILLYITLYYDLLKKFVDWASNINFGKIFELGNKVKKKKIDNKEEVKDKKLKAETPAQEKKEE